MTPVKSNDILGTGRRKTSVARVRIRPGDGKITINGRTLDEYFANIRQRNSVVSPLDQTNKRAELDVIVRVDGGGITGQADACKLGIARALKKYGGDDLAVGLRDSGLLTRDGRMKERKKYGLRGARRGTQFSKR
jgi:small subunit ribosomal protein S9